ncbi:hypothetical protein ABH925_003330 [Streptacidiphilus sp. EB129]
MQDAAVPDTVLLGIRHHGPGSARAVGAALRQYRPDIVLIEGPPEADGLLGLAEHKDMVPPVALLGHVLDEPAHAAFWPFASFSPEWVALRHALDHELPVRFIDLPAAHTFALAGPGVAAQDRESELRLDPIAELARAAGHEDPEQWWDDAVEHRLPDAAQDALAPFRAIAEAMTELRSPTARSDAADGDESDDRDRDRAGDTDARREAYMRRQLRAARRAGYRRIAVVCGAWHVPALAAKRPVAEDDALLKGLPKVKVEMTWVPWTHRRLSQHTGYGAGIASPGWYQHLFDGSEHSLAHWMTRVAALLREEDFGVSSAHVIEAVRLAETLAAVRGRPLPGLDETLDAVRSVMCDGSDVPLALVQDRLVVGDVLGEVPDEAPTVPLQRDLTRLQRSLRLRPEAAERELDLDLRKENDAARSRLLHRLALLGVHWGRPAAARGGSTGTFRESWRLRWEPELAVSVAEAGIWGTTVAGAAAARARDRAAHAGTLGEVTALAEACLLADLPEALPTVLQALADRAALDADVAHLAEALPALVRSLRYGDVRGTDSDALRELAEGLAVRICVGLPPACNGLDRDGAAAMAAHLGATHSAIGLLETGVAESELRERWAAALRALAARDTIPGLLRGRAARLLLDDDRWDLDEAARQMRLTLSPVTPPAEGAGWIEGFLAGGGMLLVHDTRLLGLVDDWIGSVPEDAFPDVLPLLRRTFAGFEPGVRRTVGERIRNGTVGRGGPGVSLAGASAASGAAGPDPAHGADRSGFGTRADPARAGAARTTAALLLGLTEVHQ